MICPKCGRVIPDGTQCPCGAPLLSSNPAVNVIKTLGSSPKFLAVAILYSVAALFSAVSVFNTDALASPLYYYAANYGLNSDAFYTVMEAAEGGGIAGAVIGLIPAILIGVSIWLFYVSCRNVQTGNVSTAGLTICKVISYISLVGVCLLILLLVVCFFLVLFAVGGSGDLYSSYYSYGYGDGVVAAVMALLIFVLLVALAVLALLLVYEICVIKTINRIKASALHGVPDNRVPRFLTVFMMIMGVLNGLSGLVALFTAPLGGLASLAAAACMVLMSLLLSDYRRQMTMLLYPPVQPVYPQPPMPPYPPQQ